MDEILDNINGIFFTGGDAELNINIPQPNSSVPYNILMYNANYLVQKAIDSNNKGQYLPVWGTCMGFRMLHIIANDLVDPTIKIDNEIFFTRNLTYN